MQEELTQEDEERIWIASVVITFPVSFGGVLYMIAFVRPTFSMGILYLFLLWFPISAIICFFTYEIGSSLKVSNPLLFHAKRFLFRTMFGLGYSFSIVLVWVLLSFFLSPFISDQNILLIAYGAITFVTCMFIVISKTRYLLIKLFAGER
jgi:hypothetical protein